MEGARTFADCLITHCAPTLASLKTAGLFRWRAPSEKALTDELDNWNRLMEDKGVSLVCLRWTEEAALIYVFREKRLMADWQQPGAAAFLRERGFHDLRPTQAIAELRRRLESGEGFPHEIGLFLGYPLGDVIGFIENSGRNCQCTGCWKVYGNAAEAMRTFLRFQKCRMIYRRLFQNGRTVRQLTVAA